MINYHSLLVKTYPILSKTIVLAACLLMNLGPIHAQEKNDSLRGVWLNKQNQDSIRFKAIENFYILNSFAVPDSSLKLIQYHIELANNKKNNSELAKAYSEKGLVYFIKDEIDSSMVSLNKSLEISKTLDDPINLAKQYTNMGNLYRELDQYQLAARHYYLGLNIFEEHNIVVHQADILSNLGLLYYDIDNYEFALDYLNQALVKYKEINIEEKMGNIWLNIGGVYYEIENYTESIRYCEKALTIIRKTNDRFTESDCYFVLAECYKRINDIESSRMYIDKSLEIMESIDNKSRQIRSETFIAGLIFESDKEKARAISETILQKVDSNTERGVKAKLYKLLYQCYKANGNYDSSLEMHENYVTINDSIQNDKYSVSIIREAIQNEYDSKLFQKQLENEQAQAQLKLDQLNRTYSIAIIGLLIIAMILFFARANHIANRQKREALLEELETLKNDHLQSKNLPSNQFELQRDKLESFIDRKINETDWKVLNILLDDPVIPNKEIAEKAFLSVDGIGSSLRRMYEYFEIKESKYKKISLLMEAIKISNG